MAPVVHAHRHPAGIPRGDTSEEIRVLDRRGAEDDPGHPALEQLDHVGLRADPASRLDRDVHGPGDGQDRRSIGRSPQTGGVQIHHVQPRCAAGGEATGQVHGVPVLALAVEVALGEPHRPTVADVDGRVEVHHRSTWWTASTKLARIPNPTLPDFSGWNWAPHTMPRSAEAVTVPPYSQVDEVSAVTSGA